MTNALILRLGSIVVLMLICTVGLSIAPGLSTQASPQRSDEKVIEREQYPEEPVEISDLAVRNIKIALHRPFSARSLAERGGGQEEDWLENLEFTVSNRSDKPITYLAVSLRFALFGNPDPSVGLFHHLVFGVDPRASGSAATFAEPFSLNAGASYTVSLPARDLQEIKTHLTRLKSSLAEQNKVTLRITIVAYEDGLQWQLGKYVVAEKLRPSDNKAVEKHEYDNEPYEIADLSVKNIKIVRRERRVSNGFTEVHRDSYEFSARSTATRGGGLEEDWLDNLQLTFRNKSDKQITFIGLSIQFPETQVNGPMMVPTWLRLGIDPTSPLDRIREATPLALEPGATVTITLSAEQLKSTKDSLALRKFQLADLNRAVISIDAVVFADGMKWSAGQYYKLKPGAPKRFERIDK